MGANILVVEDEPGIQELISVNLTMAGYNVLRANDAEAARCLLRESLPDLLMVDWEMPGQSGIALIRLLRAEPKTAELPMIMLTARSAEHDKVLALESGADDYITKPFKAREMIARVYAVLRRRAPQSTSMKIGAGGLHIDPESHQVTAADQQIVLSPTEFKLLHFLMSHPERVYSRAQLLDKVWGMNAFLMERTVDAHVGRLRNSLEASGHDVSIETVRGIGYRFVPLCPQLPGRDAASYRRRATDNPANTGLHAVANPSGFNRRASDRAANCNRRASDNPGSHGAVNPSGFCRRSTDNPSNYGRRSTDNPLNLDSRASAC